MQRTTLMVAVVLVFCVLPPSVRTVLADTSFGEVTKLTASNGVSGDSLGKSVAIDGDTMVVGADGSTSSTGVVYVFVRNFGGTNNWGEVAILAASDGASYDQFGFSVAIDGDTVVVGSVSAAGVVAGAGAAYVFHRNHGGADNWGQVAKLVAPDGAYEDVFGHSVAIDGDSVVVGAALAGGGMSSDPGAAHIFRRNHGGADSWGQVTKLTGSLSTDWSNFGMSVAVENEIVFVGAPGDNVVYTFERNHGGADSWGETGQITASNTIHYNFGNEISVSGDWLAVGSYGGLTTGVVWLMERNQGGADNWGEVQRIEAPDGSTGSYFGISVSVSDNRLLVGAARSDAAATAGGAAHIFERNIGGPDNWGFSETVTGSGVAVNDYFGFSVALSGGTFVAGVLYDDDLGSSSGSAYVFSSCSGAALSWTETTKAVASDGFSGHQWAADIDFNGDIAVVGAEYDADLGDSAGAAYILMRNLGGPDNWGELKKIYAADGGLYHHFGQRVAMSGDTVVIGTWDDDSLGDNSGAAYVFSRNFGGTDNWGQVAKLTASDGLANAWFGYSVDIDEDIIVVGAPYDTGGIGEKAGAAYVFNRNQGGADNWGEVKKLTASDGFRWDMLGYAVTVSGDIAVAGAWWESDGGANESGAAYVFYRNLGGADNWGEIAKLKASDADTSDYFASALDLDNDTLVVGANSNDDAGFSSGSAYVFERNQGGADIWGEVAKLTASDDEAQDMFGSPDSVAVYGDIVVIGAYGDDDFGLSSGSVYVFERNAGGSDTWGETAKLNPSDSTSPQSFGSAVVLTSGTIMIAAKADASMGAVYFFDSGCPEYDFGDAEDPSFPTLMVSDGARHIIGGPLFLGSTVDQDLDGQPSAGADGDDDDPEGDDEDGVTFIKSILNGHTVGVDVEVSVAGLLNAWIDFENDGDWNDVGEQIFTDQPLTGGLNSLTFTVPGDAAAGETVAARFRVSTAGGLTFTGVAPDGEVEDHLVDIEELDYGDAPDPTFPSLIASDGARHVIGGPLFLGSLVDAEPDGQPTSAASGDDIDGTDDEDGFNIGLLPIGNRASGTIIASATGLVNGWVDFNGDGDWADAGEQIFTDYAVTAGDNPFLLDVPATAMPGHVIARIRIDSGGGLSPTGLAPDGEVEDHAVLIVELDWGDAPDPTYPTLGTSSGAYHIIGSGNPFLGASIDGETDGQPTAAADGDDVGGADDEDGIVFTSGLGAGLDATIEALATGAGLLDAWIDFNGDGDWADAGEQVFDGLPLVTGVNPLSFAVPAGATVGSTYARFRYATTDVPSYSGGWFDGEVEDYQVEILEGPDLQIEITSSVEPAPSGRPLTYTITVTNNGPLPATSVTVTDTLPGELLFVSSTPGGPDCTFATDTLTCDLGSMAPSDTTLITIETVLDHPIRGGFSNTAAVIASETDPIPANNTATVETKIGIFIDGLETGDTDRWSVTEP